MANRSLAETSGSPFKSPLRASTFASGQVVRLASVRFLIFLPSRHASRSNRAGRELRLGTTSIYMGTILPHSLSYVKTNIHNRWLYYFI